MIKKYILIVFLIIISLSFIVFGLATPNIPLILVGCIGMAVSYFILKTIRKRYEPDFGRKPKRKLDIPKKKIEIKLKYIILAIIGIIGLIIGIGIIQTVLSGKSYLDIQSAINEGCKQLEPNKFCRKDPSSIIVPFDVNSDGLVGGDNDTLEAILETQDCTGDCIRMRCGCPQ